MRLKKLLLTGVLLARLLFRKPLCLLLEVLEQLRVVLLHVLRHLHHLGPEQGMMYIQELL